MRNRERIDTGLERMPPQDQDAERALLGSMLLDNRAFEMVVAKITADHFYYRAHALIWEACLRLYQKNEPMDAITIADELRKKAQLDEAGGVVFLAELSALMATGANIRTYADILIETYRRRGLIELAARMAEKAYDDRYTPQAIQGATERALERLSGVGGKEPILLRDAILEAQRVYQERKESKRDVIGLRTGFSELDRLTLGLIAGEYSLLAGRPSDGKSAFVLQAAQQIVGNPDNECAAMIFSLEMAELVVTQRLTANRAQIPFSLLRRGRLQEDDFRAKLSAEAELSNMPMPIDPTTDLHILELRAKARQMKRRMPNLKLIVVDYLQLITGETTENRNQEVSSISRNLKALAKDLDLHVLAVSQLNRGNEQRAKKRPMLADLRDCGALEQDADNVFMLYNPGRAGVKAKGNGSAAPDNVVELIIAKQRNGPLDSILFNWKKECMYFSEQSPIYGDEDVPQTWWQQDRDQEIEIGN